MIKKMDPNFDEEETLYDRSLKNRDGIDIPNSSKLQKEWFRQGLDVQQYEKMTPYFSTFTNTLVYNDIFRYKEDLARFENDEKSYKKCRLCIKSPEKAICTPVNGGPDINIEGRYNCNQAFTDDIVYVKVHNQGVQNSDGQRYGEVVAFVERERFQDLIFPDHPVLICQIDARQNHYMIPLDKTVPKINILQGRLRKNLPELIRSRIEIHRYDQINKSLNFSGYHTINYAERKEWFFIVVYLKWKLTNIYPLGAVIDVVHCSDNIADSLALISIENELPYLYSEETVDEIEFLKITHTDMDTTRYEDMTSTLQVITIDDLNAMDLGCAISIQLLRKNEIKVGIHVADLSQTVIKGTSIDKEAYQRGFTHIMGKKVRKNPMLPEPISEYISSFVVDEKRPAFSFFFLFGSTSNLQKEELRKTIIKSSGQYGFKDIEDILNNKSEDIENTPARQRKNKIKCLYALTKQLRYKRLGNKAYSCPVDIDLTLSGNPSELLKSQFMVEELNCLVESYVGKLLTDNITTNVPLFKQAGSFNRTKRSDWYDTNIDYVHIALTLQGEQVDSDVNGSLTNASTDAMVGQYCQDIGIDSFQKLLVPVQRSFLEKLRYKMNEDVKSAIKLFSVDNIHPKQALAIQEWFEIKLLNQYVSSESARRIGSAPYCHFTSPLRRYCDIINQRLLQSVIDRTASPYTTTEINTMCVDLNSRLSEEECVRKQCKELALAKHLKENPVLFNAFVSDVSIEDFGIFIPNIDKSLTHTIRITFNGIDVCSMPELSVDNDLFSLSTKEHKRQQVTVAWQKRLYDYGGKTCPDETNAVNHVIYPHANTVFLGYNDVFVPVIEAVIQNDKNKFRDIICELMNNRNIDADDQHVSSYNESTPDVNSEVEGPFIIQQTCSFQTSFHHGQILRVQLSAEEMSGKLRPVPTIFDLTQNIKICLCHIQNPIKFLHHYATKRSKQNMAKYKSINEYINTWLPIVEMESTVGAVRDEQTVTISDIPIEFQNEKGQFSLYQDYCDKRDINFGSIPKDKTDVSSTEANNDVTEKKYYDVPSCDYLCIMIKETLSKKSKIALGSQVNIYDHFYWQVHAKIEKICNYKTIDGNGQERYKTDVQFVIHNTNAKAILPKKKAVKMVDHCRLEIIFKPKVDRRVEIHLKNLNKATRLAKQIAVGEDIDFMGRMHIEVANELEDSTGGLEVPGIWEDNIEQHHAIRRALKTKFKMIQGPPGTGKTYTGVKLVYLFSKFNNMMQEKTGKAKCQIIFCGPSNRSVDLVARLILEKLGDDAPRIIRLYGSAYENLDYPIPGKSDICRRAVRNFVPDEYLVENGVVLHHIIRQEGKPYSDDIKKYDEQFQRDVQADAHGNRHITTTVNDIKEYKNILVEATKEELKSYDVIFCTTSLVHNPKVLGATKGRVYQLIVDESGMCSEPSSIAAIIASRAKQVVMIGDHKQLRPIIKCDEAKLFGLETSLFERYSEKRMVTTMLKWQYRMHPSICHFPSKQFYKNELKTAPGVGMGYDPLKMWPGGRDHPHVFCHVDGDEEILTVKTEDGNMSSRSNAKEVELVVKVLRYMIEEEHVSVETINIMSQYNAQCSVIHKELTIQGLPHCTVSTVVSSQGGEWDYVIFSLVRSVPNYKIPAKPTKSWCLKSLGFITDQNQINVALTRARRGLIIIGNRNLLNCDEVWTKLLADYQKQGCVVDGSTFLS